MQSSDIGSNRIEDHPVLGPAPAGEVVTVTVDGREIQGIAGEPVAATLLAHGIRTFRTMPETGEPRGLFSGVGRSPDGMMIIDGAPNSSASQTPLRAGMIIETQHGLGKWVKD